MPDPIRIEACLNRRQWRLFERIPEILHGDDPAFVPPMPGEVAKLGKRHQFEKIGTIRAYVAFRGSDPVGRVASIENRTHNEFHDDRVGFFGFFSFVDAEVAGELMDRVRSDLAELDLDPIRGPFNPTQNDECGLQVEGLGERPYFGMPYNPPWYMGVYETLGLEPVRDHLAYRLDPGLHEAFDGRMASLVERLRKRMPVTVRAVDLDNLEEEAALVSRVFNESLAEEWNFMPLSPERAMEFTRELVGHLGPDCVLIAEVDGVPAGISIGFPDLNEFMEDAKRLPRWLRWPRLIWLLKTRACRRGRWAVFGMLEEYRERGGTLLLVYEAISRGLEQFQEGELSWTQDINNHVNRLAEQLGLEPYRRYRVYETGARGRAE